MRSLKILYLFSLILLPANVVAQLQTTSTAPALEELIREAITSNPGSESLRFNSMAVEQRTGQMEAWSPPEVRYQYNRQAIGIPGSVDFMNVNTFSVTQMIPFPGKISDKVDMEQANYEMSVHHQSEYDVWLARQVKEIYYELWLIQNKIDVNLELQDLLNGFISASERMFEVGTTGLEAVLSARTQLARLRTEEYSLNNEYRKTEVMMNQLLNREPDRSLGVITELPPEEIPGTLAEHEQKMLVTRPDIQSMRSGINMTSAEVTLAERNYYPDLMVGVMYMQMPAGMENQLGFMASLQIPMAPWSSGRFTNRAQETRLQLQAKEKALENSISMAQSELQQVLYDLETQLDVLRLYREEVIPQAEETVSSISGSFQTGRTNYLMVLESYKSLEIARLDYHEARAEFHKTVAKLEQLTGIVTD